MYCKKNTLLQDELFYLPTAYLLLFRNYNI